MEIDRRHLALEQTGANRLEVDVPAIARPGFNARIMPKERRAAVAGRCLDAVVVSREKERPVPAQRMTERANSLTVNLFETLQDVDGDRMFVSEFANGRPLGMLLIELSGFVRTFGWDAVAGNEVLRRDDHIASATQMIEVRLVRIVDKPRHSFAFRAQTCRGVRQSLGRGPRASEECRDRHVPVRRIRPHS